MNKKWIVTFSLFCRTNTTAQIAAIPMMIHRAPAALLTDPDVRAAVLSLLVHLSPSSRLNASLADQDSADAYSAVSSPEFDGTT